MISNYTHHRVTKPLGMQTSHRLHTTWREIVEKDCQSRELNREDAMDRDG